MVFTTLDPSLTPIASIGYQNINNILINGGMEIWQRNSTFTNPVSGAYTADRWECNNNGNTASFTISKETTITDGSPVSLKWNLTATGGTTVFAIRSPLEGAQYAGLVLTARVRVRVDSGGSGFAQIALSDNSGSTSGNSTTTSGASTWETLTVTRTISSTSTQVNFQVNFNNAAGTAYVDNAMLVIGSVAVPYVPVTPAQELANCQRYYEKSYLPDVYPGANTTVNVVMTTAAGNTGSFSAMMSFKVTKRTNPTVTLYTTGGTSGQMGWSTAGNAGTNRVTTVSTSGAVVPTWGLQVTQSVNNTDNYVSGHFTAEAEI